MLSALAGTLEIDITEYNIECKINVSLKNLSKSNKKIINKENIIWCKTSIDFTDVISHDENNVLRIKRNLRGKVLDLFIDMFDENIMQLVYEICAK